MKTVKLTINWNPTNNPPIWVECQDASDCVAGVPDTKQFNKVQWTSNPADLAWSIFFTKNGTPFQQGNKNVTVVGPQTGALKLEKASVDPSGFNYWVVVVDQTGVHFVDPRILVREGTRSLISDLDDIVDQQQVISDANTAISEIVDRVRREHT